MNPIGLLLFLALAYFLASAVRSVRSMPPQALAQYSRRYARYFGIGLLLLLALTGRLPLLFTLIGGLIVLGYRTLNLMQLVSALRQVFGQLGGAWPAGGNWQRSGTADHESTVQARFVRMSLDHARGELRGQVLEGRYARRWLNDMSLDELLELLAECQTDHESATLVQAYLDKVHGDSWRSRAQGQRHRREQTQAGAGGQMGAAEALQVLGLQPGASRQTIVDAHRRLMQKVHPDRGGSDYLAAKLNQAKDVLLGS